MNTSLPARPEATSAALEAAAARGPAAVVELAQLCLWLVGQREDPRTVSVGPDGSRPLGHLWRVMARMQPEYQPDRQTQRRYRPHPTRASTSVPASEGRQRVARVIHEAAEPGNLRRRYHLWQQGLATLAQAGVGQAELAPLIQLVVQHWSAREDGFGDALEALAWAGEPLLAMTLQARGSVSDWLGVRGRAAFANTLIDLGQAELAQSVADKLWSERRHVEPENLADNLMLIARVYGRLGALERAREMISPASVDLQLSVESAGVWERYLRNQAFDLAPLLARLAETKQLAEPKHRASVQIGVLELLLAVGAPDEAWVALRQVRDTLLVIPLWSKLEYRTDNAAEVLWPYRQQYAEPIFKFASELLVGKAHDTDEQTGGAWPMVQVISGLRFLIRDWAGEAEVQRLIEFLGAWQRSS